MCHCHRQIVDQFVGDDHTPDPVGQIGADPVGGEHRLQGETGRRRCLHRPRLDIDGIHQGADQGSRPGRHFDQVERFTDPLLLPPDIARQCLAEQRADLGRGEEVARLLRAELAGGEERTSGSNSERAQSHETRDDKRECAERNAECRALRADDDEPRVLRARDRQ